MSSCISTQRDIVWPHGFPNRAEIIKYERNPIQCYNTAAKTYVVTAEFIENAVNNKIFIDEILIWKHENGIR